MPPVKISFSLRAFVVYFIILATLSWFILDKAIERLNVALRQSAESVLVDTANLLATSLEQEFNDQTLDTWRIERLFSAAYQRKIDAQIYNVLKEHIDTEVYVTNRDGMVVYDSSGQHTGEDFSEWRDVRLTLEGEYGARTSFRDPEKTAEGDAKIMVIAAPIRQVSEVVGVVSVVKPIRSLEVFLLDESTQLKQYAIGLLALAMLLGYGVSYSFTSAISRLARFANEMAAGKKVARPEFMDKRFSNLSRAIAHLRQQIDGKEYVENYVHSLTHELKTPITAIQASSELLSEDLPSEERQKFIDNIQTSNSRMSSLVDRVLSLARLEGLSGVSKNTPFNLAESVSELVRERSAIVGDRRIQVVCEIPADLQPVGDALLLSQAISNLLDNAIEFCPEGGLVRVAACHMNGGYQVSVFNQGNLLDDFVLEKAFDRFFSMPGRYRHGKSTGLGLSFVREIMSLHQGSALLRNSEGGVVAILWWPSPAAG